jgi:hypothetical protein
MGGTNDDADNAGMLADPADDTAVFIFLRALRLAKTKPSPTDLNFVDKVIRRLEREGKDPAVDPLKELISIRDGNTRKTEDMSTEALHRNRGLELYDRQMRVEGEKAAKASSKPPKSTKRNKVPANESSPYGDSQTLPAASLGTNVVGSASARYSGADSNLPLLPMDSWCARAPSTDTA